ncbi:MAG TPA: cell division protein ZapA [Candidatus Gallibacteroides avistercoris]|uniref:Cell division protein ZapA n=1 Tax=Candidatus Gallibacteroides avistercoris TaxID=2840833 RepID=A0A9D1SD73_9BACT|nr:cell division protein ZapA [Candidatus Gallibacteroides avistercoris]
MNDKFTIHLKIAGGTYPIRIERGEEERYRKAATMVDEGLAHYMELYRGSELNRENFLALVAFRFAFSFLSLDESQGPEMINRSVRALIHDIEKYLEEKK